MNYMIEQMFKGASALLKKEMEEISIEFFKAKETYDDCMQVMFKIELGKYQIRLKNEEMAKAQKTIMKNLSVKFEALLIRYDNLQDRKEDFS